MAFDARVAGWLALGSIYGICVVAFGVLTYPRDIWDVPGVEIQSRMSPTNAAVVVTRQSLEDIAIDGLALAQFVRSRNPGAYDDLDNTRLEQLVRQKRPDLVERWRSVQTRRLRYPGGRELRFISAATDEQIRAAADEYWQIASSILITRQWRVVGMAVLWWIVPIATLYVFGWTGRFLTQHVSAKAGGAIFGGLVGAGAAGGATAEIDPAQNIPAGAVVGALVGYYIVVAIEHVTLFVTDPRREYREARDKVRKRLGVALIILGSGIATMGFVESDGVTAGFGVILMVSGAFLAGLGRTLVK